MKRIPAIDFTRGLVMIIMALDHVRDLMHIHSLDQQPTDLKTTWPILFFTRWITHLCAPTFVFLSGLSAFLAGQKGSDNRGFLFRRGCILILIECTFVNFALWTDIRFRTIIFEVIGAIGMGFILLAALYKLSPKILGIIAIIIIAGHDLLTGLMPSNPVLHFLGALLMGPSAFPFGGDRILVMGYAVLPWFGIMLAGFACGPVFLQSVAVPGRWLVRTGVALLFLFLLLRSANIYGDPAPWSVQKNVVYTLMSFLNVSKYPPSLLFTLVTLGILFLILAIAEKAPAALSRIVITYGRTPLFYFVIHLYIIHIAMFIMVFSQGFGPADLVFGPLRIGRPDKGSGLTLPYIYLIWLGLVGLMFPLCKLYNKFKTTHPQLGWLRYL